MSKRLLTLNDLEKFYSNKKKSFHFTANEDADAIVVQVPGTITFSENEYDPTLGLLPVHLQSCHIDTNRNHSNISMETMEACKHSIFNRPILGYIHQLSNGEYDFAGHEMYINDDGDIEYEEISVGTIPESCNPELIYDEEKGKTYLEVDGYIYEEYTRAADILRTSRQKKVSVEMALLDFAYNAKSKVLDINKFYFSGVTILGTSRDESESVIEEGMLGSNIKLKDFSENNNSMFSDLSEDEHNKLIDTLEKLNNTLSKFNIDENYRKEDEIVEEEIKVNEEVTEVEDTEVLDQECVENAEVTEVESTEEATETITDIESEEIDVTPEVEEKSSEDVVEDEKCGDDDDDKKKCSEDEEVIEDEKCGDDDDKKDTEKETIIEDEKCKNKKYSRTFELSTDDVKWALYQLLGKYEELNNDWYYIVSVYDEYFIYVGCMGNYFGQKYSKNNETDTVEFVGESYVLYAEFLTETEKIALNDMRNNYSSIQDELNTYKEAEELADKATVFEDEAYASYLDTDEFKSLMSKETMCALTKEQLLDKADAALGKLVKVNKAFSISEKPEEKKPSMFAFAKIENKASFLDGLLKKSETK